MVPAIPGLAGARRGRNEGTRDLIGADVGLWAVRDNAGVIAVKVICAADARAESAGDTSYQGFRWREVPEMTAGGEGQGPTGIRAGAAMVPKPISAGPEMAALGRFYQDVTWNGIIHEGGMGPGTPAMTGVGRGAARLIQDGRWIVADCEQDQFLRDGTFVLKWQLHWVSGWDPEHGEYRAVMTDSYGHAGVYRGHIDGDRLVFESAETAGTRLRFTWDVSDPGVITWRNEMAIDEGSWFLIEEYPMVPQ